MLNWKKPVMFAVIFGISWFTVGGAFSSFVSPLLGAFGTYAQLAVTVAFTAGFKIVYDKFLERPIESAL